ncbi:C-GCAxxG-C-C family protein [Mariniphaga sp.]|uniref:C-GCAxxG-C-C family protein n=1 Tax=Mariniphaga sp. TaxID=1954475 RepID=UPI003563ECF8
METKQKRFKSPCKNNCNRRLFILKGSQLAAGITFIPGILNSSFTNFQQQTKEEIHQKLDELVYKNFQVYGTCSQATFSTLNEVFDLNAENITKALASFPGIAMRGETCGAVSACLLGIALVYEKESESKERPKLSDSPSMNFCTRFENEYGSTRCRDVIRKVSKKEYQITKPEDYVILAQDGALNNCPEVVKKALHFAADIIMENV